jgi:glucose-6-phosphate dehydrogenase assembly protein OpcA
VQAWILAHCHLSRAGAKQVCCEQITFLLGKDGLPLIPNIVFSHLDSDLPLVLWWRGEFPPESEEQLWTWVDRLIFDSQGWTHMGEQFGLLRTTIVPHSPRMTLCDLNWTRSLYLRQAVAQIFDHPEFLDALDSISAVEIVHAPGMKTTALLMTGWMGAQLGWKLDASDAQSLRFIDGNGHDVTVTLREEPGRALGSVQLTAAQTSFLVEFHYLMPCGKDDAVSLLNDELMSGGKHKVYLKAVDAIVKAV